LTTWEPNRNSVPARGFTRIEFSYNYGVGCDAVVLSSIACSAERLRNEDS
jgi:hypothetical protein